MKYDHIVKVNGEYYPAGEDVPETKEDAKGAEQSHYSDEDIVMDTEPVKRGRPKKNG